MAENTQAANLGFEAKLFLTADKLRGSMDASEYKHVALGLVFLKYISDAFNTVFVKLQADEYADEDDAVAAAREIYLDYRFKQKNGLPVISKRFADVAALCRATMKQQLDNGVGKKSFRDYIIVIDKYLVPFFGDIFVTSIDYEMLQKFARWREAKMGREPRSSTLNTHNSALNRIFDEAVARGYMNKSQVPVLVNKGRDSVRRPDFTREEYATLIRKLPSWIDAGREGKSRDMRHLLRDYILIRSCVERHPTAQWRELSDDRLVAIQSTTHG